MYIVLLFSTQGKVSIMLELMPLASVLVKVIILYIVNLSFVCGASLYCNIIA